MTECTRGVSDLNTVYPPLLTTEEVAVRIMDALRTRNPLSLVRLGDGEALTLAQEVLVPLEELLERGHFLPLAGVNPPDLEARDRVASAVRSAHIVGVTTSDHPDYGPMLRSALSAHGISLTGRACSDATVNYALHTEGHLRRILLEPPKPRVLLAGNRSVQLAAVLRLAGADVVAAIGRVDGCRDVDRVLREIAQYDFDLGLIPAGVAAVILCAEAAKSLGKVMLDFGHLADELVSGSKIL